jgi:hypothetical protein
MVVAKQQRGKHVLRGNEYPLNDRTVGSGVFFAIRPEAVLFYAMLSRDVALPMLDQISL